MPRLKRNLLPNQAKRTKLIPPLASFAPSFTPSRPPGASLSQRPSALARQQHSFMKVAMRDAVFSRRDTVLNHLLGNAGLRTRGDLCSPVIDPQGMTVGSSVRALTGGKYDELMEALAENQLEVYGDLRNTVWGRLQDQYDRYYTSFRKFEPRTPGSSRAADEDSESDAKEDGGDSSSGRRPHEQVDRGVFPYVSDSAGFRVKPFTMTNIFQSNRSRINKVCHPKWFKYREWLKRHRARVRSAKRSLIQKVKRDASSGKAERGRDTSKAEK